MKNLLVAAMALMALGVFSQEVRDDSKAPVAAVEPEKGAPLFFGFGNTGVYSGYQLYGSLVNSQPCWQTYLEGNVNLQFKDADLGFVGLGLWFNSDLTSRRHDSYGRLFNEFDPNVHWGKTFWFDDDKTWGLDYLMTFVWFYYPHHAYQDHSAWGKTYTTMDWSHSFALVNPWVIPFLDIVHEFHESDANLLQAGLKKELAVTDSFKLTPSATLVWRNSHYTWCFPTGFGAPPNRHGSGVATFKLGLDANYQLADRVGVFAKVAWCSIVDPDLRDNCDNTLHGNAYGDTKDFAWGGVGVSFNF